MVNVLQERIKNIKEHVSLRKVLDYFNIQVLGQGEVEQLSCPFHGKDKHASARIYSTNTMYCFTCKKYWDVISLTQELLKLTFVKTLEYLEKTFNVSRVANDHFIKQESFIPEKHVENCDDIFGKSLDRNEAISDKNYGYELGCHVLLKIYHNHF